MYLILEENKFMNKEKADMIIYTTEDGLTMSGEQLLQGNGSISHKQAVDKATDEYKKYKVRTFSTVEEDYLNSIKILEKKTDKKH